ncbi:RDD family protein [Mycoplasmatota bacterium WC44]
MKVRRISAYFVDLLIFIIISTGTQYLGKIIAYNIFGQSLWIFNLLVIVPLMFILLFIFYGITSVMLKGSIGKKIFDLKVSPTTGWITPVRLFIRDILGKYLIFLPITIATIKYIDQPIENLDVTILYLNITGILILLLLVANLISYVKDKELFVDNYFDTIVENDIPTAVEYLDILEFKEKNKTTTK